jgi:glycosyltransferase involved in cell wall biosynthesis
MKLAVIAPGICHQVNLQRSLGGGEIFTRFFAAALAALGWRTVLFVARGASFWRDLRLAETEIIEVSDEAELTARLPSSGAVIMMHSVLSEEVTRKLSAAHCVGGFAHMPLYEREPRGLAQCRRVFGVSRYVIDSARAKGLANVHPEPIYGVADLSPRGDAAGILGRSPYDWDTRKFRDRLLGVLDSALPSLFASGEPFVRRPGCLSLGIVSRLTPIKQFPLMFESLALVLARHPRVRLEIFGSGGYESVRALRRALAPCEDQVDFWGHQADVASVYRQMDYVLSGLPEKEALGLNLIEAQACGTPVLAVRKPPFIETVSEPATGFFFEDPREDGGRSFDALLETIREPARRPRPLEAGAHLQRFSEAAFHQRVQDALSALLA